MNEKKLYHYLKTHETAIVKENSKIKAWVHVPHDEVREFAEIVGADVLCEGGVKAALMPDTLAVDLINWILCDGEIVTYKDCFDAEEWEKAFKKDEQSGKQNVGGRKWDDLFDILCGF